MAGKARRVASRQAQIGRRKKRQGRASVDGPAPVLAPAEPDGQRQAVDDPPEPVAPAPTPAPAPARPRPARPSPVAARNAAVEAQIPSPSRSRRDRPVTNNFIGAEVRRILGLSGVVMAVIIALGVAL